MQYGDVFVPRRGEQFAVICALLEHLPLASVLELGCGTGALTAEILSSRPTLTITAIDGSTAMLELAKDRLTSFHHRVTLLSADLGDRSWRSGNFGAIVSCLAVHHLVDDQKYELLRDIYRMLAPGGVFVNADLSLPAQPATVELAAAQWDACAAVQSVEEFGNSLAYNTFKKTRWNTHRYPDPVDHPTTLASSLRWLTEIGFEGTDVPWAFGGHSVVTATRPLLYCGDESDDQC